MTPRTHGRAVTELIHGRGGGQRGAFAHFVVAVRTAPKVSPSPELSPNQSLDNAERKEGNDRGDVDGTEGRNHPAQRSKEGLRQREGPAYPPRVWSNRQ